MFLHCNWKNNFLQFYDLPFHLNSFETDEFHAGFHYLLPNSSDPLPNIPDFAPDLPDLSSSFHPDCENYSIYYLFTCRWASHKKPDVDQRPCSYRINYYVSIVNHFPALFFFMIVNTKNLTYNANLEARASVHAEELSVFFERHGLKYDEYLVGEIRNTLGGSEFKNRHYRFITDLFKIYKGVSWS